MKPIELIMAKRKHLNRLAAQKGSAGEMGIINKTSDWIQRPKGKKLKNLLQVLQIKNITIKGTSFDAISIPNGQIIDFYNPESIENALPNMVFIEIKTSNQKRVLPGFSGYFFALTEAEIEASEVLGVKHQVALYNGITGELLITNVQEIINRSKSKTWQLSVQL